VPMVERSFADGSRIVTVNHPGGTSDLLLLLDGRQVSRVVIVPMLMRIGAAVVRMDGIGGVSTEEEFRNRGYSRRVMETAVEQMRRGDAALSTLFGIEDFYQKFGYETTGPEYTVVLPLAEATAPTRSLPRGWRFRPLTPGDMPAVMRLYHANTRRATGALVRHDAGDDPSQTERLADLNPDARKIGLRAWNRLQGIAVEPGEDACRVLVDQSGRIGAYAWFGANWWMGVRRRDLPGAFHIAEGMARDAEVADTLLVACRTWAEEAGSDGDGIALAIPPEGPVAMAAAYEGGQMLGVYTRGGNFMGRVLDLGRLLRLLQPELAARVRSARLPFQGRLIFRTDEDEAAIVIRDDDVQVDGRASGGLVVELPQTALARLCLGGFDPADVLARLPNRPNAEVEALLRVLFPRRMPHIYPMDRF
jgi:GNAT superfamily N-acetyltransferase